ncbi:hypothetical protein E1B28_002840 [Marasmius oreades]|uniref:GST N-terminal domain-containing protein n=1 Tax=Marasmius oreades TaxID=181124 RepID=A0A9P7RNI3_9AGAR|nr:uncharacterized protein E1B28_002840 [Marasmius oreades]KAG7086924.1 hypothetical protein E1B28_002840 [Marasmius oreades]
MIILHYLNDSRAQRVLWLCEELSLPYVLEHYKRDNVHRRPPPELRAVEPLGTSPSIVDTGVDGTKKVVLGESGAIVEYLLETYGQGTECYIEPKSERWTVNLFYTHLSEGSLQPLLFFPLLTNVYKFGDPESNGKDTKYVCQNYINPNLIKFGRVITNRLRAVGPGNYLAGESTPTAADFMMFYTLGAFIARAPLEAVSEEMKAYIQMIKERPAYKRALEKGGPFSMIS